MILKAVCDYEDPAYFDLLRSRYNQEDFYVSFVNGSTMKNYYDGKIGPGRFF